MPRGNTATIDVATLRLHWASHSSMAAICTYWSISRDQLIRLRDVHRLAKRHDRKKRHKPPRFAEYVGPDDEESQASLSLAPSIEARAAEIRATWSDHTRAQRHWTQPTIFEIPEVELPDGFDVEAE